MAEGRGELVPKDERELSFGLEVSTGELLERHGLPSAKLSTSYTRKWEHRARRFFGKAVEYAGTDEDGLADRVEENDAFADALAAAAEKAVRTGDEEMHDWLARLVAAAFNDDAKVDTAAFMISILARLEPVHLRELVQMTLPLRRRPAAEPPPERVPIEEIRAEMDVRAGVRQRLESLGLVEDTAQKASAELLRRKATPSWRATGLGRRLLLMCEAVAEGGLDP